VARFKDHYGIAIGINRYPSLRPLSSAVRDAIEFCDWLTDEEGGNVEPANVQIVRSPDQAPADRFDAKPVQDAIDRVLRDFGAELGQRLGKRLYFYFAGHGFGPSFNNVGMLMANASMSSLSLNIGLQGYRHYFHERGLFDEVVFILDCCRDNALDKRTSPPGFDDLTPVAGKAPKIVDFIALAAGYGEKAFAPVDAVDGERRGILTKAALEALRGDIGAFDAKGRVTARTFKTFVKSRVKALADKIQDEKLKQDPEIDDHDDEGLVLHQIDLDKLPKVKVHIIAEPAVTGELIVRDATDDHEIIRRDVAQARDAAPWDIDLLPLRYTVENSVSGKGVVLDLTKPRQQPYVFRFS
jgi:hypothetical protein